MILNGTEQSRKGFVYNIDAKGAAIRLAESRCVQLNILLCDLREGRYKLIVGNPGSPTGWIHPSMGSRVGPPITQSTWLFDLKSSVKKTCRKKVRATFALIADDPNERRDLSRVKVRVVSKLTKKLFELARTTVPSVHRRIDDRGNPIYLGGAYATGWC
jgi:hypothetical protein